LPVSKEFTSLIHALEECQVFQVDSSGVLTAWIAGTGGGTDLMGRHFSLLFTARDRERGWPERMLEWARSASRVKDEGWRLRSDEQRFWAEHVIAVIREEDGEVRGFMNILFDADRRLAAERAVHEADRRILEYQHIAQLGSYEFDPASGRYLVTPEILRIVGLPAQQTGTADFVPIPAEALFRGASAEDMERILAAQESGAPASLTIRMDGPRYVQVRSEPVRDREGNVVRWIGTIQDVTELIRTISESQSA
jgi:PAS domain-containing protein